MSRYWIIAFLLISLTAIIVGVLVATAESAAEPQQTGIELDIDRSKPRPKMDAPKTSPRRK